MKLIHMLSPGVELPKLDGDFWSIWHMGVSLDELYAVDGCVSR